MKYKSKKDVMLAAQFLGYQGKYFKGACRKILANIVSRLDLHYQDYYSRKRTRAEHYHWAWVRRVDKPGGYAEIICNSFGYIRKDVIEDYVAKLNRGFVEEAYTPIMGITKAFNKAFSRTDAHLSVSLASYPEYSLSFILRYYGGSVAVTLKAAYYFPRLIYDNKVILHCEKLDDGTFKVWYPKKTHGRQYRIETGIYYNSIVIEKAKSFEDAEKTHPYEIRRRVKKVLVES